MVTLFINNTRSRVDCDGGVYVALRDLLSYEMPGSGFVQRANPHWKWDGRVRLLKKDKTYPTGLTRRVIGWLKENEIEYRVQDEREIPRCSHEFVVNPMWKPRDYQLEAVEAAKRNPRGVFLIGVGGGKSFIAALIAQSKGLDTLFVTPDTGLREQIFETFRDVFQGSNIVSTDIKSKAPIIISNIQSLVRKNPGLFNRFKLLLTDEQHHSSSESYLKLNLLAHNAYYRYGFTSTFVRTDGTDMTMHGVLSDVIYKKSISELIEEGWLVRPHISIIHYQLKGWSRLNYRMAYDRIVQDVGFNTIVSQVASEKIADRKQTLILVRRKEHGELLHRMIQNSEYVCGNHSVEERESLKSKFLKKEIPCLVATNIFGEGIDIPSIDVLINARLQKTQIQTTQGCGRALRLAPGKIKAEIFDFLIVGQKHLKDHSLDRLASYRRERAFKIKIIEHYG